MVNSFEQVLNRFRDDSWIMFPQPVEISIPDAERRLRDALGFLVQSDGFGSRRQAEWSEHNYRPVVRWMECNKGRGLLLIGPCGLGKTLIAKYILPFLIRDTCGKFMHVYSVQELNSRPDEVLSHHLVCVDDVGTEQTANIYGNRRVPFMELCDEAEKRGMLLVCTSNLTVPEFVAKYGERTVDRLRAVTTVVPFSGKSLRK